MKDRSETARRNSMSRRKPPNAPAFHFRSRSSDMAAMHDPEKQCDVASFAPDVGRSPCSAWNSEIILSARRRETKSAPNQSFRINISLTLTLRDTCKSLVSLT
jgi:hypothetical protein